VNKIVMSALSCFGKLLQFLPKYNEQAKHECFGWVLAKIEVTFGCANISMQCTN